MSKIIINIPELTVMFSENNELMLQTPKVYRVNGKRYNVLRELKEDGTHSYYIGSIKEKGRRLTDVKINKKLESITATIEGGHTHE